MPTLLVMYPAPTDVATFERRYKDEHLRLVKAHLGMAKFRQRPVLGAIGGTPPWHMIAELEFATSREMEQALATSGGQATAAHAAEISTGGAPTILIVG